MDKKKSVNIEVGRRLKIARERNKLTQEQLAEQLDITPHFLSSVERGVTGLSLEKLRSACLLLHISSDYLLFGTATPTVPDITALSDDQKKLLSQIIEDCTKFSCLLENRF